MKKPHCDICGVLINEHCTIQVKVPDITNQGRFIQCTRKPILFGKLNGERVAITDVVLCVLEKGQWKVGELEDVCSNCFKKLFIKE